MEACSTGCVESQGEIPATVANPFAYLITGNRQREGGDAKGGTMNARKLDLHPDNYTGVYIVDKETEYVSITEAAEYLGVHVETIRRMIKRNDLPADMVIVGGRAQWQIKRTDLGNAKVNPQGRPSKSNKTET